MAYVKNTWVDREGTTRYHETVDEDGALIFTPNYEKVTEIGTPVNADNMNHIEEGIEDHENRITVLEEGQDTSEFLNTSQITNCILEIPQNIKYTFVDGTFTLLKGSILIFPHGTTDLSSSYPVGSDYYNSDFRVVDRKFSEGNFFVWVETQTDLSIASAGSLTADSNVFFIRPQSTNKISYYGIAAVLSSDTKPTVGQVWYDTANNVINTSSNSFESYTTVVASLPICNFTRKEGAITSINEVYNGIGYIGNSPWVDKGVKGLIPNGRNEDGTLKNIEYTTTNMYIRSTGLKNKECTFVIQTSGRLIDYEKLVVSEEQPTTTYTAWYKPSENILYSTGDNDAYVIKGFAALDCYRTTTQISNYNPKSPFRAVDYNDLDNYVKGMPVGTVFSHTCSASFVPENSLPCNGSEYTQAQFPNLYNDWLVGGKLKTCTYTEYSNMLTTYGQCPMWGLDTTNKKFKVPTIKDGAVVQQAMSNSEIGKAYNAGLPNITGEFWMDGTDNGYDASGCVTVETRYDNHQGHSGQGDNPLFKIDASRSSSIYGNSNTVQMNAVALRYFVVVATKAISQSAMDWSSWASSLNGKLNADHSNDTKPYITQTYVNGTSWYRVWSDGWCEQGGYLATSATGTVTINLLKDLVNTDYSIQLTEAHTGIITDARTVNTANKTTSSFQIFMGSTAIPIYWQACGYIA